MKDVAQLGIKALNGGLFVVIFALIAEALAPKRFAGLFSAAPSVALANLAVTIAATGRRAGEDNATGMLVGAVAMTAGCLLGVKLVARFGAKMGSLLVGTAWMAVAEVGYLVVIR